MAVLDKGIWYPNREEYELSAIDTFTPSKAIEAGRYHLYISLACPFAHRPYGVISYLGLEDVVSISSVAPERYEDGWLFNEEYPDEINQTKNLVELFILSHPAYSGKVTVPILWDKVRNVIIGNDSASLAMDFATRWLPLAKNKFNLVPENYKNEIIALNEWLHGNVNRRVYNFGFAQDQKTYNTSSEIFFDALEILNARLKKLRYLFGDEITLSDLFLMPTLVRFETVYEIHFKANKQRLNSFENLYRYMLDLVAIPNLRKTVDINHSKLHYYMSHKHINPTGIVPAGPKIAW